MANFVLNRARRLFSYSDLQGQSMETTSINIEAGSAVNSSGGPIKSKRKCVILTSCLAGLMVIILIGMSVKHEKKVTSALRNLPAAFSSASSANAGQITLDNRRVSLFDTSRGRFYASKWNGTWINGLEFIFQDYEGGLNIYNVQAQNTTQIMSPSKLNHFAPYDYQLSADKNYLLIKRSSKKIFRRSSYGTYAIISLHDHTLTPLKPSNLSMKADDHFLIRFVSWGPQGNSLAYVDYDGNIFYRAHVLDQDDQITTNGQASIIYNGIPDWVFEEEVFEDNSALWWSPDATKLVWGSFDDSDVEPYVLQNYGSWENIRPYPELMEVRYPKVGAKNPQSSLWMTDLSNNRENKRIFPPKSLEGEVHFARVTWADQGQKFAVTWFNRVQNKSVVTLCDVQSVDLDCSENEIFSREERNGWVPYKYTIEFNPKPPNPKVRDFVTIMPAPFLRHHYRQLVYYAGDSKPTFLTKVAGAEVTEILKWTPDGYIYYMSTLPDKPGVRHLFRVKAPPSVDLSKLSDSGPECVTCNRTMETLDRRECQYYDIEMSKDGSFMTMICQGPDIPYACICHTPSSHLILTVESNQRLEKTLADLDMPRVQFLEIDVSESDQKAQVKLMLPPDFDSSRKYPLVVYAYGGPGFQTVNQKFDWNEIGTYLAGSADVIYATVDPRGSGYQGEDWRNAVYRRFGTAEVQSLTEVTKHLQENLAYVDKDKTAVWGWSYGGYLSLMTLAKDLNNIFKCGASVAPVVDWNLYDTYYTERYMGLNTPQDNLSGYNRSSVFHYLDNLRNKKYYLLHGTHDDNVHYQNSMLLSAALEDMDILFRQQAYPDQDHSIFQYRMHLDHSLVNFFLSDCFGLM